MLYHPVANRMPSELPAPSPNSVPLLRRWGPLAALTLAIALAWAFGLQRYLSLAEVVVHRHDLKLFVTEHIVLAMSAYALIYVAVVALSLPGAAVLTITGGLLFGWAFSAPATVLAATLGATVVFDVVKTSFGETIARRAGPLASRLAAGFQQDGFNYLLFLRLVPAVPFFAVNAVAGLSGISRKTFVLATLIGIIPGTLAFSYFGAGLDNLIEAQMQIYGDCVAAHGLASCKLELRPSALVTREILLAFTALGLVALVPIGLKRWWRKS